MAQFHKKTLHQSQFKHYKATFFLKRLPLDFAEFKIPCAANVIGGFPNFTPNLHGIMSHILQTRVLVQQLEHRAISTFPRNKTRQPILLLV